MRHIIYFLILVSTSVQAESINPVGLSKTSANEIDQLLIFAHIHQSIAQEKWQEAETELQRISLIPFVDHIEVIFLKGLVAQGEGDYSIAINLFQGILIDHPELLRVRLELARAYFMTGNNDAAKLYFESVLSGGLPEAVISKVRVFLDQINMRRDWQAEFSFALMPDSNVNQATSSQSIDIGGLPFILSGDSKQTSGTGVMFQVNGEKRWRLDDRLRLVANGNLVRRDYRMSHFDDMTAYTRLGPRYLSPIGEIEAGVSISKRWLGNHPYNHSGGLYVEGSRRLDQQWDISLSNEWQRYSYDINKSLPGQVNTTSAKVHYLPNTTSLIEGSLDIVNDKTISDAMHHEAGGGSLSYRSEAKWGLRYGVSLLRSSIHYDNDDPLFHLARKDLLESMTFDVSKRDWNLDGFSPIFSVTVIVNDSSISLYTFRRYLSKVGMIKQF
jgi:tetratricopeptide (TPR) repeat protein